jgi:HK97 family phage prohead protease/HK97 family phage major capsid protein
MKEDKQIEKRKAEIVTGQKPMVLEGYAAVFNSETKIGDFREQIQPGAFAGALDQDVRFLLNHDGVPYARSSNGSLQLTEDDHGLHYRAELLDTQSGRELYKMVERGDLNEASFAFTINDEDWEGDLRTIRSVGSLFDVSITTFGAYPQTTAEARAKAAEVSEEKKQSTESVDIKPKGSILEPQERKMNNYTLNDLQALREQKQERHTDLLGKIDSESREPSTDEMTLARSLHKEIEKLDKQIELKRQSEQQAKAMAYTTAPSHSQQSEVNSVNARFSLTRAIQNAMAQRPHSGAEAEWMQERKAEQSAMGLSVSSNIGIPAIALEQRAAAGADNFLAQGGAGTAGQGFVPVNVPGAIEALRAPAVIEQVGTTVITGATGNIQFPRIDNPATVALTTESSVGEGDAEIGAAADSGMDMDVLTLTPKRAAAKTVYSRLLIEQGGADVERVIAGDLGSAMAAFIDDYSFDAILAGCTTGAVASGAISADILFQLEAAIVAAGANIGGAQLVGSTGAHSALRGLAGVDSVSALLPQYNYTVTPYMAKASAKPFAYGNFGQAGILSFFGGLDLLADVYGSNATNGQVTLHVNRFFDFGIRQAAAVACYTGNDS